MDLDVLKEQGITCNDCYLAMQNCHNMAICCEDETGLCSWFEPIKEGTDECKKEEVTE